ncbi:unnamed protein product [Brassica rapa]|uniref:Uncharacterized protein n=1 Tax=Brassica campestris TaxID=3711 RepID=A0A3P5XVI5_BRACM|nr:unnamed protein product [Brassica rapa]VDC58942.1 unnamed protein product [Brassica rapa]
MLSLSRLHGASRVSKYTPVARTLSLNVLRVCVVLENGYATTCSSTSMPLIMF